MTQFTTGDTPQFFEREAQLSPSKEAPQGSKLGARELASQKLQLRKQQEKLLSDLLTVVDALDHAADHWQQAEQRQSERATDQTANKTANKTLWWRKWLPSFGAVNSTAEAEHLAEAARLTEVVTSAHEGIEMIRETLLTVLNQHQVAPLPVAGTPFDPNHMHALGQQVSADVAPNTVVQEVVRGYRWQDRTLREAQVIVAIAQPAENNKIENK